MPKYQVCNFVPISKYYETQSKAALLIIVIEQATRNKRLGILSTCVLIIYPCILVQVV